MWKIETIDRRHQQFLWAWHIDMRTAPLSDIKVFAFIKI
jgi:hypothetical protein